MSSATQQPEAPPATPPAKSGTSLSVWIQDDATIEAHTGQNPSQAVVIEAYAYGRQMPSIYLSAQAARALIAQLNMLDLPAEVTVAAQIEARRIDEPGLWGVVSASFNGRTVTNWVRYEARSGACWRDPFGDTRAWSELTDPTLVRDGIES